MFFFLLSVVSNKVFQKLNKCNINKSINFNILEIIQKLSESKFPSGLLHSRFSKFFARTFFLSFFGVSGSSETERNFYKVKTKNLPTEIENFADLKAMII